MAKTKSNPPFFSIVIPTLNEEKVLPLLLSDLASQTWQDFEVIHVDANSQDKTVHISTKWQKKLVLQCITSDVRNVAYQRNIGAQQAKANWIIFMDADNRIPHYFLQGIKYQIEKYGSIDVFTCWQNITNYSGADKYLMYLSNLALESMSKLNPVALGALIGLHRKVFNDFQFDDQLTVSEDHEFIRRVVKAGHPLKVFREPRYEYSLRRYKRDGTLNVLRSYAHMHYKVIMGQKITEPMPDYPMLGGGLYHIANPQQTSVSQLQKLRERLQKIITIIEES